MGVLHAHRGPHQPADHALELDNNNFLARLSAAPEDGALLCVGTVKVRAARSEPMVHTSLLRCMSRDGTSNVKKR